MTESKPTRRSILGRARLPLVTAIDVVAIVGLLMVAAGVSVALSPAIGLVVIGLALMLYAIAVSASTE